MSKKQHEILDCVREALERAAPPGTKFHHSYTGAGKQRLDVTVPILGGWVTFHTTFPMTPRNARDPNYRMNAIRKLQNILNGSHR